MDLALNNLQRLICHKTQPTTADLYKCPEYNTKQSDSEVPSMLELWGLLSVPSLLFLLMPL